ncbi:MAG: hypothetical protein AAF231_07000 [Pseudomonadota bacterium]
MSAQIYGSVVAMEFKARPKVSFEEFVEDFDLAFQMVDSTTRSLTWESADLAIIDRDYVRVAIGWLPSAGKRQPWHLIMVVGSSPDEDMAKIEPASYDFLADRVLERTQEFMPATAVLRGEASQPITPDLIDTLFDLLSAPTAEQAHDVAQPNDTHQVARDEYEEFYADMVESMQPPWAQSAEKGAEMVHNAADRYSKFEFDKAEEQVMEQNVAHAVADGQSSDPMRLTIHTLALSMALYVPPLGAALFAYTMLRDIFPMAAQAI